MTLKITIIINTNNKGLENVLNICEIYPFQYLVSATNNDIDNNIMRNILVNSPPVVIISKGNCPFEIIPILPFCVYRIFFFIYMTPNSSTNNIR